MKGKNNKPISCKSMAAKKLRHPVFLTIRKKAKKYRLYFCGERIGRLIED